MTSMEEDYENNGDYEDKVDDPELEEMNRRVQEMEEEHAKLSKMQQQVERQMSSVAESLDENSM